MIPLTFALDGNGCDVNDHYNQDVWPAQIILYLLAITAIASVFLRMGQKSRMIFGILLFLWLWMGIMYHFLFFTIINKAAWIFDGLYIIQAILFNWYCTGKKKIDVTFLPDFYSLTGIVFILYGLIIYPLLGHTLGHMYPESPTFGLHSYINQKQELKNDPLDMENTHKTDKVLFRIGGIFTILVLTGFRRQYFNDLLHSTCYLFSWHR